MPRTDIKAVIFDLDGTLLDRETSLHTFVKAQFQRLQNRLAPASSEDFARRFVVLDDHGSVWKDKVYEALVEELGIDGIGWPELLRDYEENFRHSCVPFPGLKEALTELDAQGYALAVISNGRHPFQLHSVEALGILPLLAFAMISEQEGVRKPDAEIFRRALGRLGIAANEAVYVGDHPANDIRAAKAAGLMAIWRPSSQFASCAEADAVCEDLATLPGIIRELQ